MHGKRLRVKDLNKSFETEEHNIEVYLVFKDLKYGNIYSIYKDNFSDTLYYASSHIRENTLVLLNIKNKEYIETLVKEIVWDIINDKSNFKIEIIDINNITNAEIISSNSIKVKDEVIITLNKKCIPKNIKKESKNINKKRMSSSTKILVTGFALTIFVIIMFLFFNKEVFAPVTYTLECTKVTYDKNLNAVLGVTDSFNFEKKSNILLTRNLVMEYTFFDENDYMEYKRLGLYYKVEPVVDSATMTYYMDDADLTFKIIESMDTKKEYFEPTQYDKVLSKMENDNYLCNLVSE